MQILHTKQIEPEFGETPDGVSLSLSVDMHITADTACDLRDALLALASLVDDHEEGDEIDPEMVWKAYPAKRRVNKKLWMRKFRKMSTAVRKAIYIDLVVKSRAEMDPQWVAGYVPLSTTYMNQERWATEWEPVADVSSQLADFARGGSQRTPVGFDSKGNPIWE